jgi:MarR family 2-MHQ and catechol resistance regulon transcriptional repressor
MRAAESITARVHRHLSADGLTMSQFGVLEALYHLGPLYQKEIGKKILRSGGNITMVIDNLEKRGLVIRKQHPEDRRFYMVHLTDEGEQHISTIFPRHADRIKDEMNVLSDAEQEVFGVLCKRLGLKNKEIE